MDNVRKIEITLPPRKFKADKKDILWQDHLTTPGVHPGAQGMLPSEVSTKLREVAAYIDLNTEPFPADLNMMLALELADQLAPAGTVPPSITSMSPDQRADMILDVVKLAPRDKLPVNLDDLAPFVQIAKFIGTVGKRSAASIPDAPDGFERVSIMLRMWSGCLMTGKTIADGTRSGPNTKQLREQNARRIDAIATRDAAFEAGMPAAVIITIREGKPYSFDGAPQGTRLHELEKLVPQP